MLTLRPGEEPRPYAVLDGPAPDLAAALTPVPEGVVLWGAESARDVERLGALLAVHEAETGLPDGSLRIVPVLASARAVLAAAGFAEAGPRLAALALDADGLADQGLGEAEQIQARAMAALAAAAAGVPLVTITRDPAFGPPNPSCGFRSIPAAPPSPRHPGAAERNPGSTNTAEPCPAASVSMDSGFACGAPE